MNSVILIGRLVRDPEVRDAGGVNITKFTIAVDRKIKKEGGQAADFPTCIAFGKTGEFISKYFFKGSKIGITGRLQTGSYEKDGVKHYTTDIVIDSAEFVESKKAADFDNAPTPAPTGGDEFLDIPKGIEGALPFK